MRQILFAVLITLTIVNLTEARSLAQSPLEPTDLSTDSQEHVGLPKTLSCLRVPLGRALAWHKAPLSKNRVKMQKNPPDQPEKPKSKQSPKCQLLTEWLITNA